MDEHDFENLTLTEIIRLQNTLSKVLRRRFGKRLALAFTDVVGSTSYFQRFGDEAGRRLLQRNLDLVKKVLPEAEGRIVDTAGDGVFSCFPDTERAAQALMKLQGLIALDNTDHERDHQLSIHAGLHHASVLTDGEIVTGDAVNFCKRVAECSDPGEILVSSSVYDKLPTELRLLCQRLDRPRSMKGIHTQTDLYLLEWRDRDKFPLSVRIHETGEEIPLPNLDLIRFGRLAEKDGQRANEIVLRMPRDQETKMISRWHFELRRQPDGYRLRQISSQRTEVNGQRIPAGVEMPISPGSTVRISNVMTLAFTSESDSDDDVDRTTSLISPIRR